MFHNKLKHTFELNKRLLDGGSMYFNNFIRLGALVALTFLLTKQNFAQAAVITEKSLMALINQDLPEMKKNQASQLQQEMTALSYNDQFAPELYAQGAYQKEKARPLIDFQPIYSPVKSGQVGIRKNFALGMSASVALGVDQRTGRSATFFQENATTTSAIAQLQIDLWKDFLGRSSKAQLEGLQYGAERAKIEQKIADSSYALNIRKIYWSLVANKLSSDITQGLLAQSQKQTAEAKKRQANYVGDRGEVARYEAQEATRKSTLLTLNYQREAIIKRLRSLLPSLGQEKIEIAPIDIDGTIKEVLSCTAQIASWANAPFEYTYYDEMLNYLKDEKAKKVQVAKAYSDIDLKLSMTAKSTGVDRGIESKGSFSNSYNDMKDHDRSGYKVALDLTIPLGGAKANTEDVKKLLEEKRYEAQWQELEANLKAAHTQIKDSLDILEKVVHNQKESAKFLKIRLLSQQKKFSQARVSVVDLISDQDALLASELDVIASQLETVNTLLNYFMIYTETPCSFNQSFKI